MTLPAHRLATLSVQLRAHAERDGFTPAALDGITFMRADATLPRAPVLQEPSLVLLAQGLKRGFLGQDTVAYRAGQALAVALPMQFDCDTVVGADGPMLALAVRLDLGLLAELALKMALPPARDTHWGLGMQVLDMDEPMADTTERLLRCLGSPMDTRLLGDSLVRELHYRLLSHPAGQGWATLAVQHGRRSPLRHVIATLAHRLAEPLNMDALAREAHMSPSAFYQAFRELTGHSPLQYLKALRLHRAHALMHEQGHGAAQAAALVGYASPAQFSREFKRHFGHPPSVLKGMPGP